MTTVHMRPEAFQAPLPDHIVDQLVRMAGQTKHEICGFVMYSLNGPVIIPCENIHKNPSHYFEMSHEDLERIYDDEELIIGMYHSHPNGPDNPSVLDIKYAPDSPIRYFIITQTHVHEYCTETWEAVG